MRSNRMRTGIQDGECAEITSANETLAKLNLGLEVWLIVLVDGGHCFRWDCRSIAVRVAVLSE